MEKDKEIKTISLKEFLEKIPPGQFYNINEIHTSKKYDGSNIYHFLLPEIYIYCDDEYCKGERFYEIKYSHFQIEDTGYKFGYAEYSCKNCERESKIFSLFAALNKDTSGARFYKFGELPPYGDPTPPKLIELIGPDRDYFLQGRKCENQGLGIGAFTYYRRVVENQKNRIFDRIINVAQKVGLKSEIVDELGQAKAETQFSKGVDKIKHALPESLLIDGHNPIKLLHQALSEGVHEKSDADCLELARNIRIILAEIAQKAAAVLKDDAEVKSALSNLLNKNKNTLK